MLLPLVADVVPDEQEPPYVIVPASVDEKVYSGVESVVGVVTAVTSAITGAVVSVVVVSSVDSFFSPQEMTERLKQYIRKMYKTLFIFSFTSNERELVRRVTYIS